MDANGLRRWNNTFIELLLLLLSSSCIPPMDIPKTVMISDTKQSPTNTNTAIPTMTNTFTITNTPTTIPILSEEDAKQQLMGFLENNNGCRLPCLWGMKPNVSSLSDVYTIVAPMRSVSWLYVVQDDHGTIASEILLHDYVFRVGFVYYAENGVIIKAYLTTWVYRDMDHPSGYSKIYDSADYSALVEYFLPNKILLYYGLPENIMLYTDGTAKNNGGIVLLNFQYPEQGIFITYQTQSQVSGEYIVGCFRHPHFEVGVYPEGERKNYLALLPSEWNGYYYWSKPLEEVTSYTKGELFTMFSKDDNHCVHSPITYWEYK